MLIWGRAETGRHNKGIKCYPVSFYSIYFPYKNASETSGESHKPRICLLHPQSLSCLHWFCLLRSHQFRYMQCVWVHFYKVVCHMSGSGLNAGRIRAYMESMRRGHMGKWDPFPWSTNLGCPLSHQEWTVRTTAQRLEDSKATRGLILYPVR